MKSWNEQMEDYTSHLGYFPVIFNTDRDFTLFDDHETYKAQKDRERIERTSARLISALKHQVVSIKDNKRYVDRLARWLTGFNTDEIQSYWDQSGSEVLGLNLDDEQVEKFRLENRYSYDHSDLMKLIPDKLIGYAMTHGIATLVFGKNKSADDINVDQSKKVDIIIEYFTHALGMPQYKEKMGGYHDLVPHGLVKNDNGVLLKTIGSWGFRDMPLNIRRKPDSPLDKLVIAYANDSTDTKLFHMVKLRDLEMDNLYRLGIEQRKPIN
jgi:hypothetical protein